MTITLADTHDALAALQAFQDGALAYRLTAAETPDPDARDFFLDRARFLAEKAKEIGETLYPEAELAGAVSALLDFDKGPEFGSFVGGAV